MGSTPKGYGGKDGPPPLTVRKPLVNKERAWMILAECLKEDYWDVDFFIPMSDLDLVDEAKAVCRKCPAFIDCLQFAVDNDIQFGIWGGLTPSEREGLE